MFENNVTVKCGDNILSANLFSGKKMAKETKHTILVTGGAGYIGSHTVVELQQQGYDVVIIDNLSNSHAGVIDKIAEITGIKPEFHCFNLTDAKETEAFFRFHTDLSGIIHFAAFKAVGESVADPLMYYQNNLVSLINILQGMKNQRILSLVFSSSCTVYGQPASLPVKETSPIQDAWSPYGNTKQMSEQMLRFSVPAYGVKTIALRYFNPAGTEKRSICSDICLVFP
jgi:UDP-glucose 4-epimerase